MKSRFFLFLLLGSIAVLNSCKNEFERLRATGDEETLYQKAFEYYEEEEYLKAQTLFELIINNLRGKVEAEKVYFYYAYTHYHLNRFILANYYFKNFANTFPNSEYREEADFMAAYSHYEMSPSYRLDQTFTEKAIDEFQIFANTYPNSSRLVRVNALIEEMRAKQETKAFAEAKLYFDLRQYQSATRSLENILKDFPDTKEAERIRYLMVKATFLLAENSVYAKMEERYTEAIQYAEVFVRKFPDSKYLKEVLSINESSSKKVKELL